MAIHSTSRRKFIRILAGSLGGIALPGMAQQGWRKQWERGKPDRGGEFVLPADLEEYGLLSVILGNISNESATLSLLARTALEGVFQFGSDPGRYTRKTALLSFPGGKLVETVFDGLQPNTEYYYRLSWRRPGEAGFKQRPECRFSTQRNPGCRFTFCVQGDSHPERPQMSDPQLYARTLLNAASQRPDFYICMGDDFSVEKLREFSAQDIEQPYILQRPFLGLIGQSAPIFLVNGNHEQASLFNYNQGDIRHEVAIEAQRARNRFYPLPGPGGIYTGNKHPIESIGLLKDYYAWNWGDALFVVLDNYWHSPALVDSGFQERDQRRQGGGGGRRDRDWWGIGLGDEQYEWFKQTIEQSKAKFKFVFAHHVLGTGRGGIEQCDLFEWGGRNRGGQWEFKQHRPAWEMPIHQLMVKHGVTIFFQGHDHLYARQERDGIIYQEVPMPADQNYMAHNSDRYQSGVKLPNSGHLRISVAPEAVTVDYVRSFLPKDETAGQKTGDVAYSYVLKPKTGHA